MLKKFFTYIIIMTAAISCSFAQSIVNIYVSPDGSSDGSTQATPTTLQNAITTIQNASASGETTYNVLLANGTYTGSSVGIGQQANKNVVVKAADETSPNCIMQLSFVVDGNGRYNNAESITFKNLTMSGTTISGGVVNDGYGSDLTHCYPHNINIEDCSFSGVSDGFLIHFPTHCAVYNLKVQNCTFENSYGGIQTAGGNQNLQVINCTFQNNCYRGMNLRSTNALIKDCTFTGITKYAIRSGQSSGTPNHTTADALHLENCSISGEPVTGEEGLVVLRAIAWIL